MLPTFTLHRATLVHHQLERSRLGRFIYLLFWKVHFMEVRQRPSLELGHLEMLEKHAACRIIGNGKIMRISFSWKIYGKKRKKKKNPVVNDCMLLRVMTQYHVAEKSYLFISQFFQPFLFLCFALLLTLLEWERTHFYMVLGCRFGLEGHIVGHRKCLQWSRQFHLWMYRHIQEIQEQPPKKEKLFLLIKFIQIKKPACTSSVLRSTRTRFLSAKAGDSGTVGFSTFFSGTP